MSYTLNQFKNKKTGRVKFILKVSYRQRGIDIWRALNDHFDPFRNRRIGNGYHMMWKYDTKEEASQLLSIAILKGWV